MPRIDLISLREGFATDWQASNPMLAAGEPGFEIDTGKMKVGDGTRLWNDLPYTASDGPPGPPGDDGVEIGPTPPVDTDILWADTTAEGTGSLPGPTGPQGPVGPQGATGPTGPQGTVAVATTPETIAGTDATKAVTPAGLAGLLPAVDVRRFGAKADGVTNDATAINNACASLAATGGTVFLPFGTYAISAAIIPVNNVAIVGAGLLATTVKVTGSNRGISASNIRNVRVADLTIDCDRANIADNGTTTQHGIFVSSFDTNGCPGWRIERVRVLNAWDRGICAAASTAGTNPLDIDIIDCTVSNCLGSGIFVQKATRSHVERCDVSNCTSIALHVNGGTNTTIARNRVHDQPGGADQQGICVNTSITGVIIDGNMCWNVGGTGNWGIVVGINAFDFTVVNNFCYSNAGNITIDVSDGTQTPLLTKGVVANNTCRGSTLGNGLHVSQVDGLVITGNHCSYNTQTGLEIYGRNCVVTGNISHDNGWHGISFREVIGSGTGPGGPHYASGNYAYTNNTAAAGKQNFWSDLLTNGPVVWQVAHAGSPETVLRGGIGSAYQRLDGASGTTMYTKVTGTDNTGWAAVSAPSLQVDVYTSGTSTWNKPTWVRQVRISALGAGGGGGSGRRGAAGTVRCGGGGGAGGGYSEIEYAGADLPTSLRVAVGAAGTGGAAIAANDTDGAVGVAGGSTIVTDTGITVTYCRGNGGGAGGGGTASAGTAGTGGLGTFAAGAGAAASGTGGIGTSGVAAAGTGGGGSGGGLTSGNAEVAGGAGGVSLARTSANIPAGGTPGQPGQSANSAPVPPNSVFPGHGGGGGGSSVAAAGGAGGNGADAGGGGGGGGASTNGANSGAGGNGGAGRVVIVSYG